MQITEKERVTFMSNADCINMDIPLEDIDGAVHLAFARRVRPAADIASSLNYAESVFKKLAKYEVDRVINMSSQGIYGSTEEFRTEQTPAAPATHYTMAKYAQKYCLIILWRKLRNIHASDWICCTEPEIL